VLLREMPVLSTSQHIYGIKTTKEMKKRNGSSFESDVCLKFFFCS